MVLDSPLEVVDKGNVNNLSNAFENLDVCRICQLRFDGNNFKDFNLENLTPKEGLYCSACLGILEEHNISSLANEISEKLLSASYDTPDFNIGLSVPQCLILRQASLKAHLSDGGHEVHQIIHSVKDTARILLLKLIGDKVNKTPEKNSKLLIKVEWKYFNDMKELAGLTSIIKTSGKHSRKQNARGKVINAFTTEVIQNCVDNLPYASVKKYTPCPPHGVATLCKCNLVVFHDSVFFGGRYNKYSRSLSQTPWIINNKRKGDSSVLELIGEPLKKFTRGSDIKFQSSGREDIDVRMLGTGRPFSVEVIDPKKTNVTEDDLEQLESEINGSTDKVAISLLQAVTKFDLEIMKKGEEEKCKTYAAKLWCPVPIPKEKIEALNKMTEIVLDQKTPIRVLHRRSLAVRPRTVHSLKMNMGDDEGYYQIELTTQAGTYVKEFVHGDLGRTEPSLRTLLEVPIDILELDVTNVNLAWPADLAESVEDNVDSPGFLGN